MIGREEELRMLDLDYHKEESQFVVVYGRRRIGKTYLVREKFYDQFAFFHTGLREGGLKEQLEAFRISLKNYGDIRCPRLKSWLEAFDRVNKLIDSQPEGRKVIFIDELPWMDTPRSNLVSALEYFWNSELSVRRQKDVFLVVCGSATSWIVENLLHNRGGLHNRLTDQIWLRPFTLAECEKYVRSLGIEMSRAEICEAYMIFGGVPYYWSLLRADKSLAQNIDELCFSPRGKLTDEFGYLYASLFRNAEPHLKIVQALAARRYGMTREEILNETGLKNGGNFKKILDDLVRCDFVRQSNARKKRNRDAFFQLVDCFTIFHHAFMTGRAAGDAHFWSNSLEAPALASWKGLSFERLCVLHTEEIKRALGISGIRTEEYSWRTVSEDETLKGAQIDLVIERADGNINLCEMKYTDGPFELDARESEKLQHRKLAFKSENSLNKSCRLTLISPNGIKSNKYSHLIQNVITVGDLFRE